MRIFCHDAADARNIPDVAAGRVHRGEHRRRHIANASHFWAAAAFLDTGIKE
jgi:hypothetical protein